ncbi:hypothetical protein [Actinoplanes sp. NPDC051411]|uniref:hypothetical protein n=1 Tax=Actinoplanes sp. NPDC051411 TaxID=3155522 RepID=UPI0034225043
MWVTGGAYQAWTDFLDRWAAGEPVDPAHLPPLVPEGFDGDTWARLGTRISEALDRRLVTWSETLARELGGARDEFAAGHALNQARKGLAPIRALAATPAMPSELRRQLAPLIDGQVGQVQEQLEESINRMRRAGRPSTTVEARLRTIRDNPLTVAATPGPAWDASPVDRPRRRVHFE